MSVRVVVSVRVRGVGVRVGVRVSARVSVGPYITTMYVATMYIATT